MVPYTQPATNLRGEWLPLEQTSFQNRSVYLKEVNVNFKPTTVKYAEGAEITEAKRIKKRYWFFSTIFICPCCETKTVRRKRQEGEKPENPDERKEIIMRYCACTYK